MTSPSPSIAFKDYMALLDEVCPHWLNVPYSEGEKAIVAWCDQNNALLFACENEVYSDDPKIVAVNRARHMGKTTVVYRPLVGKW